MKTNKFFALALTLILILSLSVSVSASWSTGFANLDRAIELGIADCDFDPYGTVTKGEFTDMLSKAFGDSATSVDTIVGCNEPANIGFIALAYEQATGESIADAPFWRYLSTGDYIANIEAINLVVQSLAD